MNPKYQNMRARLPNTGSLRTSQSHAAIANEADPMPSEIGVEKHMVTSVWPISGPRTAQRGRGVTDAAPRALLRQVTGDKP